MAAICESSPVLLMQELNRFDDSFLESVTLQQAKFEAVWEHVAGKGVKVTDKSSPLHKLLEGMKEETAKFLKKRQQNTSHITAQVEKAAEKMKKHGAEVAPFDAERYGKMICQHWQKFGRKAAEHMEYVGEICTQLIATDVKQAMLPSSFQPATSTQAQEEEEEKETPAALVVELKDTTTEAAKPSVPVVAAASGKSEKKEKKDKKKKKQPVLSTSLLSTVSAYNFLLDHSPIHMYPQQPSWLLAYPPQQPQPSVVVGGVNNQQQSASFRPPSSAAAASLPSSPLARVFAPSAADDLIRQNSSNSFRAAASPTAQSPLAPFPTTTTAEAGAETAAAKTVVCETSGRWRHNPYN